MRPGRLQDDLDRELRFHVTERAEELEAGGMSHEAAWQAARRQFGNHTTQVERTREMRAPYRVRESMSRPRWSVPSG